MSLVNLGLCPHSTTGRGNGHEGMHVVNGPDLKMGPVTSHGKNPNTCMVSAFVKEPEKWSVAVASGRREEQGL